MNKKIFKNRKCLICKTMFSPHFCRPDQKTCSKLHCQKQRKINYGIFWRENNIDYFKREGISLEKERERCREWRKENPEYYKKYRKLNCKKLALYMRNYRKKYRVKT